jgi:hypothetical protein
MKVSFIRVCISTPFTGAKIIVPSLEVDDAEFQRLTSYTPDAPFRSTTGGADWFVHALKVIP